MIHLSGYVVQQLIRETVHSHVYRGLAKADRRPVVIKVARESSHEVHAAAQQELDIIRRLDGLLVVRGVELDYFEDRPALVMELFPGAGMDDWLAGEPLALDRFLPVAAAVAAALAEVHERGVIHRDLKPSNILVDPETLEVCIADFGVAASLDGTMSIEAAAAIGSLAYLPPEQTGRMNRMVDSRSDLYALGATFYEMLTGQLPFQRDSALELVHAHFALTAVSPHQVNAAIPEVVSDLVMKLLAKSPDDRYQSAHGVAADLREIAERAAAGSPASFPLGRHDRARTFLLPRKLYGRERELTQLARCLTEVQRGRVQLFAVGGASGTGKTALFTEAADRLELRGGYFMVGKFDRLARNVPFSAVSHALAGLVDQLLAKPDRELDGLRAVLLDRLAGLGRIMIELSPAVVKVIGAQPAVPAIGPIESQTRICDVFWRFISAIATGERPLVMVLDDLQWADPGSLLLVESLVEQAGRNRHKVALLLLAGYRDRELVDGHPLHRVLARAQGGDPAICHVTLAPLEVCHVAELLADTLRMQLTAVGELAEAVFRKTGGNAFFVRQFLLHAHRIGLFRFASGISWPGWQWDLAAIDGASIPDDVAGLMIAKIRSLARAVQEVLSNAAVIGDELDLATLCAVSDLREPDALRAVHTLIEDGLLVRNGQRYRFTHDRIREAALMFCSDEHATRIHVDVGRHRLHTLGESDVGAELFATADHLNHGHHLLTDDERITLAGLNRRAGKQALAVGAAATAEPYLAAGLALLNGTEPWRNHFQLMFELTLEHAEVRFFGGEEEAGLAVYYQLLDRELTLVNAAEVYCRLVVARVARLEYEEACRLGISALKLFGIELSLPVKALPRVMALIRAMRNVGRAPERLLELPESTDPNTHALGRLVNTLVFPFYFVDLRLAGALTLKAVARLADDGVNASSPMQIAGYANLLNVLNRPTLARRVAQVAYQLHERMGSPQYASRLLFARYHLVEPWHAPYRESIEYFQLAIQKALDVGDHQQVIVSHVCRFYSSLIEGVHLTRVEQMAQEATEVLGRIGLRGQMGIVSSLRDVLEQLRAQSTESTDWLAAPHLRRIERRNVMFHLVASAQILVLLLRGDCAAAYDLADGVYDSTFQAARGIILVWIACIGRGIGAAIRLRDAKGSARRRYRKQLAAAIDQVRRWAVHNPVYFNHKLRWLEAERERAHGRHDAALGMYTKAHDEAIAADYPHLAAAIDVRRGELALELGLTGEASERLHAAVQAYRAWGARALVSDLEQRYAAHLVAPEAPRAARVTASPFGDSSRATNRVVERGDGEPLELRALLSASQAIAQEVTLASVLERVMANTMASAGATRGVLLLEQRGGLTVELKQRAGGKLERCSVPLDQVHDLPRSIVHYVHHSGETVVLEDAAARGAFTADPWVRAHSAKSILCAPIVKQARRVGVLFLLNELVSSAFTDRHLTTLQMLATQAAISIDNAILYDELSMLNRELEERVEDRTRALREAQQQVIDSARRAGMADVAVDVLHNVGNALTSVNVSAQLIETRLADSKLKTLTKVVDVFDEHKDNLSELLTSDPRGVKLAAMLPSIGRALTGEHETMLGELTRLRESLDSVGAVVRELEATAEDKGIAILEAPHVLLDEAIGAVRERSERERVMIDVDYRQLPGVRIDKHKARDILVGLLGNAIDAVAASPIEPRRLRVSLRGSGEGVELEITDNGVGIAAENLTRIFHGGYSSKPERRGTSLHRFANLAAAAGGSLSARSDGRNRGATFTLLLPNRARASRRSRPGAAA